MRAAEWVMLAAALAPSAGCATLAHGSHQTVTIISNPPGAKLTILATEPGKPPVLKSKPMTTPVQVDILRREAHLTLRFELDGCPPVDVALKRGVSGWTAGNLIYLNPLSMQGMSDPAREYPLQVATMVPLTFGIDFASGGAYTLPKTVEARLCGNQP